MANKSEERPDWRWVTRTGPADQHRHVRTWQTEPFVPSRLGQDSATFYYNEFVLVTGITIEPGEQKKVRFSGEVVE